MDLTYIILIYASVALALIWSFINICLIVKIKVAPEVKGAERNVENLKLVQEDKMLMIRLIGQRIEKGANAFLFQEYMVMILFIVIFSVVVVLVVDVFGKGEAKFRFYATGAFIIGSLTSILCGWIGMAIAVKSNFRTTFQAM